MPATVTSGHPYPRRGEIYLVQLDKRRPALIISTDALNRHALDVCVVPITGVEHKTFSLRIPLRAGEAGLHSSSCAKCDQVTTIEKSLLVYPPIGRLSRSTLRQVEQAIKLALDLA
ncbi:MAG TPA: type II toxin-antitoxin system PemK/MazF family toxin [Terriglobia bacterium]|nr:type II toxin-antitoxin system PemK/MazF family toxin [Terriglobia bacterium]